MKLKGISPLEQNVDRIVVSVAGLALAGAVGMQFLGAKTVKVGAEEVSPGQAYTVVQKKAQAVNQQLESVDLKTPEPPKFTLSDKLVLGASPTPVAANTPRQPLGRKPLVGSAAVAVRAEQNLFGMGAVPAPTSGIASEVMVTISPVEKINNKELAKLLPDQQPFDKASVSVEFSFNGAEWRDALMADPDGEGPQRSIPLMWWRDQSAGQSYDLVDIVSVQFERETLTNPDGTTPTEGASAMLPAPPGRSSKLEEWTQTVKAIGDIQQMVDKVRAASEDVQRPKFYDIVAGPEWKPPSEAKSASDIASKAVELNKYHAAMAENDRKLADMEKRLAAAPAPKTTDRDKKETPTNPPPAPRGGGGGKGGPTQAPSGPAPREKNEATGDRRVIEQQLTRLKAERDRIAKRLKDLGETVPGYEAATTAGSTTTAAVVPALLENPDVKLWTHDMTAQAGGTYRYRCRVVVNNPMYGRNLLAAQADLAANSLIEGPWSEWTAPVSVGRSSYFFITSASDASPPMSSQPMAGAEMFVFKYGYYRRARVQLNPGDALMGEATLPKSLKYADMTKLAALLADPNAPAATGAPPPVAPPPPVDPRSGGGKGGPMRTAGGPAMVPGAGVVSTPGETGGPLDAAWTIAVPDREPMRVDVTFLDASPQPGTSRDALGGEQVQLTATFRDEAGRILVRSPSTDTAGDLYKRVSDSAKAGETQGAVVVKAPEPAKQPNAPVTREPARAKPPAAPGGNRGGGGG